MNDQRMFRHCLQLPRSRFRAPCTVERIQTRINSTAGAMRHRAQTPTRQARTYIAIPNTRPSSIITNHGPDKASNDRPIPSACAGGLLSAFRHNWSGPVVGLQKSSGMKCANAQSFEEGTEPLTGSDPDH